MSVVSKISLRDRVREALVESGAVDPKDVADTLIDSLTDEEYRAAAEFGLRTMATEESRRERERVLHSNVTTPTVPAGNFSTKWSQAHDSLLRARVTFENRDAKFLGDCTAADLYDHADWQERQAHGILQRAAIYRALGVAVQEAHVEHVRDLPRDLVAEMFHA